jgi:Family of unknown function (DUF5908)
MPVEIRELIIKTNIASVDAQNKQTLGASDLALLKKKLMEECLNAVKAKYPKNSFDR